MIQKENKDLHILIRAQMQPMMGSGFGGIGMDTGFRYGSMGPNTKVSGKIIKHTAKVNSHT